jgi:hypothetical protein
MLRAGRTGDAEATLSRGMAMFEADSRPKIPGERALWLYKRGAARLAQRRLAEARSDLTAAAEGQPMDWARGRIHLDLGRTDDLLGRRDDAVAAYRLARGLCAAHADRACVADAERLLKTPLK